MANPPRRPPARTRAGCGSAPPDGAERPRRALTRERVVAEALAVIGADGAGALSMRALAARLGVVAWRAVPSRAQQGAALRPGRGRGAGGGRLPGRPRPSPGPRRSGCSPPGCATVLENHPGIAALLKTRDPLGPHSLALAEAFLAALQQAGLPQRETALAFSLIYDYTLGFALSDRTTVNEQRVQDTATRHQLHAFFRSLPADRFPALAALGEHVWADNRDERFTAGLDTLLMGLQAARRPQGGGRGRQPGPAGGAGST